MSRKHLLSRIFQPVTVVSKNANKTRQDVTSQSQRLMLELGIIHQANPGCFHFLPLGMKSLNKLIKIVDEEMFRIGGQKVLFPGLINEKLWKNTGRLAEVGSELFKLRDRHDVDYVLSPTHEEAASHLLSSIPLISYKHFPLKLYQISSKFRDEMKPRFGLMRGREFIMKDMYSFDTNVENAKKTYEQVCEGYDNIFTKIGLDFVKVLGSSGTMGGTISHEYQFKSKIGEDSLLSCTNCHYSANVELCGAQACPECGENEKIYIDNGIEVGHTFFLGDRYSKPLKANFLSTKAKPEPLQMGSYGLGLSRILAASIEVLSSDRFMRWPDVLAPYVVVIIPPKAGSKEEQKTQNLAEKLYENLEERIFGLRDNVLLDDRTALTIGRRHLDAQRVGYRYVIIINEKSAESTPLFELNDCKMSKTLCLSENELCDYIKQNTSF